MYDKPNFTTICPYCRDSRILKVNGSPIYKCKNCSNSFLTPIRGKKVKTRRVKRSTEAKFCLIIPK